MAPDASPDANTPSPQSHPNNAEAPPKTSPKTKTRTGSPSADATAKAPPLEPPLSASDPDDSIAEHNHSTVTPMPKKKSKAKHPKKRKQPTKPAKKPVPHERKAPESICGAKTRSGRPCAKPPIKGATRCRLHGGASPNSLDAARRRLLAAADPAAAALVGIVEDKSMVKKRNGDVEWEEPSVTNSERIRAAEAVLDRAGVPRATKHEVEGDFRVAVEARKRLRSIFGDDGDS